MCGGPPTVLRPAVPDDRGLHEPAASRYAAGVAGGGIVSAGTAI
jgi:hypothetical protein